MTGPWKQGVRLLCVAYIGVLWVGVLPVRLPQPGSLAEFTRLVDERLLERGWARPGDTVILVAGEPIGTPEVTNSLAVHRVGNPDTGYARFSRPCV